ncbi:hypothetical protein LQZ21_09275 [Treponema sp. TIM-1]|uniref:hypothetical protein n=1 Tax=Treponema sp. TIM-1 TaxID=2898417 RepID=UPI00397EF91A
MKITKPAVLVIFGILAALLAVGCSNPSFPLGGGAGDAGPETYSGPGIDLDRPFTVTFTLGQSDTARSVAGPDANRIYMTGATGIRNFVQLVVVDTASKEIKGFAEDRKTSGNNNEFTLTLDNLARGKEYAFLLLMGHWEHNGSYVYSEDEAPTLLCAGLRKQEVNITGDTVVTITMYPITVDTKFSGSDGDKNLTAEPKIVDGDPDAAYLVPGSWHVKWTVQRAVEGTNGFEKALIPAQKIIDTAAGDLKIKEKRIILSIADVESVVSSGGGTTVESFSHFIGLIDAESEIAKKGGAVNFNLEYVPFGLADADKWSGLGSNYNTLSSSGYPVWIIRNGLNDKRQDTQTNFKTFGESGSVANGKGAVEFGVWPPQQPPTQPPAGNTLEVYRGFFGKDDEPDDGEYQPSIVYGTRGYDGNAVAWYAVVAENIPPDQRDYNLLDGEVEVASDHPGQLIVNPDWWQRDYWVYVIISKDGQVSPPFVIYHDSSNNVTITGAWAIEPVNLTGITPPETGYVPDTVFDTDPSWPYSGVLEYWYENSNVFAGNTFTVGNTYKAQVLLTATTGYGFPPEEEITLVTHMGSTVVIDDNTGQQLRVSITFPLN